MFAIFLILIIITCVILGFFVLIQNPKGGGLAGSFGGLGNQMMGAKQSTDVVEKGTWYAAGALLVFVLASFVLTPKNAVSNSEKTRSEKVNKPVPAPQQAPATPAAGQAAPASAPAPATQPQGQAAPATPPQQ